MVAERIAGGAPHIEHRLRAWFLLEADGVDETINSRDIVGLERRQVIARHIGATDTRRHRTVRRQVIDRNGHIKTRLSVR